MIQFCVVEKLSGRTISDFYSNVGNARKGASRYLYPVRMWAIAKVAQQTGEFDSLQRIFKEHSLPNADSIRVAVSRDKLESYINKAKDEGDFKQVADLEMVRNWMLTNDDAIREMAKSIKNVNWKKSDDCFEILKVDTDKRTIEVFKDA